MYNSSTQHRRNVLVFHVKLRLRMIANVIAAHRELLVYIIHSYYAFDTIHSHLT